MKRNSLLITLFILAFTTSVAAQQESDPSILTLERIFSTDEFSPQRFGPARWLDTRSGYTTLEPSESDVGGKDIVLYEPESGRREILVSASRLVPDGKSEPLKIENYSWSVDGKKLLVFTNTARVWRLNTRGDYWVLELTNWELHKLGGDAEPSTLMFSKFSPDGNRVGYVRKNNIYIEDIESGQITQLTKDGSEDLINGTFDWVYEEEFGLRDGFRWSPDGRHIAYWQLNSEGVRVFHLINNTDELYARLIPIKYPKVGETNSACRVGVVSAEGGDTLWFEPPGDSRNHYIAWMEWANNSDEIAFQRLNRLQNTNELILGDIHSGRMRRILVDHDEAWLEVVEDFQWLDGGNRFLWISESAGWRRAYLVSRSGGDWKSVTPPGIDVISIQDVDESGGWMYYIASPDNPTQRYLYRVPLDGSATEERLTPTEQAGSHRYQMSPDCKWAFHTFSNFDTPPVTELVHLPKHEVIRTLVGNKDLREKVNALKRQLVEFLRIDIGDGVLLDGWCMRPYNLDTQKRYPLLFFVYGEPAAQTVLDSWRGTRYLWHLMLTQQGYVVISVDNRGTPAPRGREWRKIVYRQIGILASQDQAVAARAIINGKKYIDPERIGIWGWSGGGSMSLNAIFRYPDLYHTAMSVAPVPNQRYYDTIYQERYMGLPKDNPEGFKNGSPITFAHQLKGNLLVIHGTGDDNVHYQGAEALFNRLIEENKRFTMMAYPNRSHGIYEGKNTTRHLYELLTWYLNENLPAGPR